MKRRWIGVTAALAFVLLISQSGAENVDLERETLTGIPSVNVDVGRISENMARAGLSADVLRSDAELRLRAVGIRVDSLPVPGQTARLYVTVAGVPVSAGGPLGYAAYVELQFLQEVNLTRDRSRRVYVATWSAGAIVTGTTADSVRKAVRDLSDLFANAYLSVNPPKREVQRP
jgi:hypothetical protein